MSDSPAAGRNLPALSDLIPLDIIEAQIDAVKAPLIVRRDELVASGQRFIDTFPTITDDETDAKSAQVLAVMQRFTGKSGPVETARIELLKPLRGAVTTIGSYEKGPFANIVDSVERIAVTIRQRSIAFKQAKETQERARRKAEADRLAAEAEMTARLATSGSGVVSLDDAVTAAQTAEKAQEAADVKPAELTRAHGDALGTSSLARKRVFVITDAALVPRYLCIPSESLIRSAIGKADGPIPSIPGISITDEATLTVRR